MKINGDNTGGSRPGPLRDTLGAGADKLDPEDATLRTDSVEISDAGRASAADVSGDTRAARLLEIRQRVLHGAYDTDAVVADVARRIIDRGDLQPKPGTGA